MQESRQPIVPLTAGNVANLKTYQGNDALILSLFLDLRDERFFPRTLLQRYDELVRQFVQQKKLHQDPRVDQDEWLKETQRIRRWLEQEHPLSGQGIAIFSDLSTDIWQAFLLPVAVMDRLEASDQPYIRPLEVILGEAKHTMAVHIDPGAANVYQAFLGEVTDIAQVSLLPVTGEPVEEKEIARSFAERLQRAWDEETYESLVIAGSSQALDMLYEELPQNLKQYLKEETLLENTVDEHDFFTQLQSLQARREQRIEEQRVDDLVHRAGDGLAVLGLEQTLLGLKSRKLALIIVDEDYHLAGGVCPNCGFIREGEERQCLVCGMDLRPELDIIEVALQQMLHQGGKIEVVRSESARKVLAEHGRIGALLRDGDTLPPERDKSNRMLMDEGGEINRDVIHDEAIEESFPASDPPGWTH